MRDGSGKWLPSQWRDLMRNTLEAIDSVSDRGPVQWAFGGGTALAIDIEHRTSYDIDTFVDSASVVKRLVPVNNETTRRICWNPVSGRADYHWPGSYLKLIVFQKGEIDFLNATTLVDNAHIAFQFEGREILRERPREIIAKKIYYRGARFKGRDVFDLACTYSLAPYELEMAAQSPFITSEILARVRFRIDSQQHALDQAAVDDTNPTEAGKAYLVETCATALKAIDFMEAIASTDPNKA